MSPHMEYRLHVAALVMAELVAKSAGVCEFRGDISLRQNTDELSEIADRCALSLADHMGMVRVVGEQKR